MQGERWMDAELGVWQQQGLRALPAPAPPNALPDPRAARAAEAALRLERELNALRDARRRRERARTALEEELAALAGGEQRDRDSGQAAEATAALSGLRERIQGCNQRLLAGEEARAALERDLAAAAADARGARARADALRDEVAAYAGDCAALRAQLRGGLHGVEKALAQGKLATMAEIREGLHAAYAEGLAQRRRTIERQVRRPRGTPCTV